jgi:NADPH-dependent 2,4-dienoyl-CoA reductase/sulfur reductase-like enzyme
MARATMADPQLAAKARGIDVSPLRPCIGLNECIHRKQVEGLPYACGVNPRFAREHQLAGVPTRTSRARTVLVVGGGPGGTELAAQCAEQGHRVTLVERGGAIGGALAVAALARGNAKYRRWIEWQTDRLERIGVDVRLGCEATADLVRGAAADVVIVATGATPRVPPIPGVDAAHVVTAAHALRDPAVLGQRVAVVSEDDGPAPLSVSDHLAGLGHEVTLVHQTPAPSPLVGKYSVGGMLARLVDGGVTFVPMARAVEVAGDEIRLRSTYGSRAWTIGPFDSVVLATGAVPDDALFRELRAEHPAVHLLGDAFAPRRMVSATRQAWELAARLD